MRKIGFLLAGVALCAAGTTVARADVTSDRAAAMLVWPDIVAVETGDTEVQISNTSLESILVHCFYENANSHCSNTGEVCRSGEECFDGEGFGRCTPGWVETDFRLRLTPRQPLAWLASAGRQTFPLTGVGGSVGPDGSSNASSRVPPVPEQPFDGVLRCIAINNDGTPSDRNVLVGHTTLILSEEEQYAVGKDNAIGLQAMQGAVNDDRDLVVGGPEPEYNGCPNFLILNHFFDGVFDPASGRRRMTTLTLVPCANDYLRQVPGNAVVQYLVYNEFEQRFSTSRSVDCKFQTPLSLIDTTDEERSIFSAGVAGTVVGQTRMNPLGGGLLGHAIQLGTGEGVGGAFAAVNIHYQGDRPDPDIVTVP